MGNVSRGENSRSEKEMPGIKTPAEVRNAFDELICELGTAEESQRMMGTWKTGQGEKQTDYGMPTSCGTSRDQSGRKKWRQCSEASISSEAMESNK